MAGDDATIIVYHNGDEIEAGPGALIIRRRHHNWTTSRYADIADIDYSEGSSPELFGPNAPYRIGLSIRFLTLPVQTGLHKRSPDVPDSYYLLQSFSYGLDRKAEVVRLVEGIRERWEAARIRP